MKKKFNIKNRNKFHKLFINLFLFFNFYDKF